jgi:hypothetical protein
VYLSGESFSLKPFSSIKDVHLYNKSPLSFSSIDGFDLETRQSLMNGLAKNTFKAFIGQLSDIDYAG